MRRTTGQILFYLNCIFGGANIGLALTDSGTTLDFIVGLVNLGAAYQIYKTLNTEAANG